MPSLFQFKCTAVLNFFSCAPVSSPPPYWGRYLDVRFQLCCCQSSQWRGGAVGEKALFPNILGCSLDHVFIASGVFFTIICGF